MGIDSPRCPSSTKTFHIEAGKISSTYEIYVRATTDQLKYNPEDYVAAVNTIDVNEFVLLLEKELDSRALIADTITLFNTFDMCGTFDEYDLDVADGLWSLKEFVDASTMCACSPGTAFGKISLTHNAIKHEFDLSIVDRCQSDTLCPQGYLGIDCCKSNAERVCLGLLGHQVLYALHIHNNS